MDNNRVLRRLSDVFNIEHADARFTFRAGDGSGNSLVELRPDEVIALGTELVMLGTAALGLERRSNQ